MRHAILILPFLLAATPVSADHDRHHRSVPRVKAEVRLETPAATTQTAAAIQTIADRPASRAPVRVVLPSPFSR